MSKSDIQIAREAKMDPINKVLAKINVPDEPSAFSPMGRHIAKINFDYLKTLENKKNGKLLWRFYLKEKNTKYFRYGGKRYDYSGGNPWGGISADIERGIVYVSTGNAGFFTDGTTRPGKNKYSNSVSELTDFNPLTLILIFLSGIPNI